MPIVLKSRKEIEQMRKGGSVAHRILHMMAEAIRPGVTTYELNEIADRELAAAGAVGLSKNYPTYQSGDGFPAGTCISVNEEVVHGIPGPRRLKQGDIVTLDLAIGLERYCCDTAITVGVGEISDARQKLLDVTQETLQIAIDRIKPGERWSDIARAMQKHAEDAGYAVIREFVGHGIGRKMHEDPKVPNFVTPEQLRADFRLRAGMTFAVEPMLAIGDREVNQLADGWTVVTADSTPSCHFEHTIAVTPEGSDVLSDGREPWGL